jgi:hypothetical protein
MKHRQNRGRILLPAQTFQVNAAKVMELQVDEELLKEIRLKTARDPLMQEVITKQRDGERKDSRIALGLCQEEERLLTYKGLLWIPDDNQL